MAKISGIPVKGVVLESFPNAQFKIKLENGHIVMGYASGKMQMNFIRILPGDSVELELSPYDLTKGRITHRGIKKDNNA